MPVRRLITAVFVQHPTTREELILLPGECPEPEVAALVTNPDAWDVPPDDCEAEPEPIAVGEPDSTADRAPDAEAAAEPEAAAAGAKKTPSRRARSASAS